MKTGVWWRVTGRVRAGAALGAGAGVVADAGLQPRQALERL